MSAALSRRPQALLRADANGITGLGHTVRSLVLARELIDRGVDAHVWGRGVKRAKALATSFNRVQTRELSPDQPLEKELEEILRRSPELVVVDGYHFPKQYFEELDREGVPYGVIDDGSRTAAASPRFVLDPNPSATPEIYRARFPEASIFVGSPHLLVRREIRRLRQFQGPSSSDVFVCMGGSDVKGHTLSIVGGLVDFGLSIQVALGPIAADYEDVILSLASRSSVVLLPSNRFAEGLGSSKVAVVSSGTSLWESLIAGRPTLPVVVAENQVEPAEYALRTGAVSAICDARSTLDIGSFLEAFSTLRAGTGPPHPHLSCVGENSNFLDWVSSNFQQWLNSERLDL